MAFESLSTKLQNVFKNLKGKGRLSEADVKTAMREVKLALLEADVNFKVVKNFVASVTERAVGQDVLEGLNPAQTVIKIVNEELTSLMGDETTEITFNAQGPTVIMMCGLQGAGKTTTAAKLAGKFKSQGKRPLLVACDIYRPAAIEQLKINGGKQEVPVFEMGTGVKVIDIVNAALKHAESNGNNVIILDTAGRLHIDEEMMQELRTVKESVKVDHTVLTVDAMTGQDVLNVAETFDKEIGITGVILTKLDGDTRGGAALSIKAVTGKPILYVGMGEKLSDLEQFYPDRMAGRILGMGDMLSLIEKVQSDIDEKKAKEMEARMMKAEFNFNDFYEQIQQMKKMGGINSVLAMMPDMGNLSNAEVDDDAFKPLEAIINSMTKKEREKPDIINVSRKRRIAAGAGVDIAEVNRLMKQFEQMRKMMKQMNGMMKGKKGLFGKGKLPFGLG
ncbi:MAG: signal recognition particle protein [Lachnospiraceae bacterium]|nr:signal recognition particle protein [Lachnospiraceae bacterium]